MVKEREDFVSEFSKFYEKFFNDMADGIDILANIQEKYKDDYKAIQEFASNPESIRELIDKLQPKEQAILLNILLQAGNFGKKSSRLFDMNVKEKREFAKELKSFAKGLSKIIKIKVKSSEKR